MEKASVMIAKPGLREEVAAWQAGYQLVAGLDEAGRGAWAGPVYAAAVILPPQPGRLRQQLAGVRDSKTLTPAAREKLLSVIEEIAVAVGVGSATPAEIDRNGIVPATRLAMRRALAAITPPADYLLLDYITLPQITLPQRAFPRGEQVSLSVAAASIVAKVYRDRLLVHLDKEFPGYGFARHKGYGTAAHQQALARLGATSIHRHSWAPLRALADMDSD